MTALLEVAALRDILLEGQLTEEGKRLPAAQHKHEPSGQHQALPPDLQAASHQARHVSRVAKSVSHWSPQEQVPVHRDAAALHAQAAAMAQHYGFHDLSAKHVAAHDAHQQHVNTHAVPTPGAPAAKPPSGQTSLDRMHSDAAHQSRIAHSIHFNPHVSHKQRISAHQDAADSLRRSADAFRDQGHHAQAAELEKQVQHHQQGIEHLHRTYKPSKKTATPPLSTFGDLAQVFGRALMSKARKKS